MRRFIVAAIASLVVAAFAAVPAAASSTGNKGQPNQECESRACSPRASAAPASCTPRTFTRTSPPTATHAVSQYDVACFQLSPPPQVE